MRESLSWYMVRLVMWLSEVAPCAYTERLRASCVSKCMKNVWY
jgi:hypothetical protein